MNSKINILVKKIKLISIILVCAFNFGAIAFANSSDFEPPPQLDVSTQSWSQAFDAMHAKISQEYAFTAWDNIQWDEMYNKYRPAIVDAEKKQDKSKYYLALLGYISSLNDYHANLYHTQDAKDIVANLLQQNLGGSYGLIITKVDNGKFVASYVAQNSAAAAANIQPGDEIVVWNNKPIVDAVNAVSLLWEGVVNGENSHGVFTDAGIIYEKLRFLVRDKVGKRIDIAFINSSNKTTKVTLTAIDDNWDTINRSWLYKDSVDIHVDDLVQSKILPSGYGYIKILSQACDTSDPQQSISYKKFAAAIRTFNDQGISAMILDLRGNLGSGHELASDLIGFFYNQSQHLVNHYLYNYATGNYDLYPLEDITTQNLYYKGTVIVLTDIGTVSSGEYMAFALQKIPNIHILSFYPNTDGSLSDNFAFPDGESLVKLPGGYEVDYAVGYIAELNGKIAIQADKNSTGGVTTDVKIPMSAQTAIDIYTYNKDPALDFAVNCLNTQCWAADNY